MLKPLVPLHCAVQQKSPRHAPLAQSPPKWHWEPGAPLVPEVLELLLDELLPLPEPLELLLLDALVELLELVDALVVLEALLVLDALAELDVDDALELPLLVV